MAERCKLQKETCMARVEDQSGCIEHLDEKQWSCQSAIPNVARSPWTCEGWEVQHSQWQ